MFEYSNAKEEAEHKSVFFTNGNFEIWRDLIKQSATIEDWKKTLEVAHKRPLQPDVYMDELGVLIDHMNLSSSDVERILEDVSNPAKNRYLNKNIHLKIIKKCFENLNKAGYYQQSQGVLKATRFLISQGQTIDEMMNHFLHNGKYVFDNKFLLAVFKPDFKISDTLYGYMDKNATPLPFLTVCNVVYQTLKNHSLNANETLNYILKSSSMDSSNSEIFYTQVIEKLVYDKVSFKPETVKNIALFCSMRPELVNKTSFNYFLKNNISLFNSNEHHSQTAKIKSSLYQDLLNDFISGNFVHHKLEQVKSFIIKLKSFGLVSAPNDVFFLKPCRKDFLNWYKVEMPNLHCSLEKEESLFSFVLEKNKHPSIDYLELLHQKYDFNKRCYQDKTMSSHIFYEFLFNLTSQNNILRGKILLLMTGEDNWLHPDFSTKFEFQKKQLMVGSICGSDSHVMSSVLKYLDNNKIKKAIGYPLHMACNSGYSTVTKKLLSYGQNPNDQDELGERAFIYPLLKKDWNKRDTKSAFDILKIFKEKIDYDVKSQYVTNDKINMTVNVVDLYFKAYHSFSIDAVKKEEEREICLHMLKKIDWNWFNNHSGVKPSGNKAFKNTSQNILPDLINEEDFVKNPLLKNYGVSFIEMLKRHDLKLEEIPCAPVSDLLLAQMGKIFINSSSLFKKSEGHKKVFLNILENANKGVVEEINQAFSALVDFQKSSPESQMMSIFLEKATLKSNTEVVHNQKKKTKIL